MPLTTASTVSASAISLCHGDDLRVDPTRLNSLGATLLRAGEVSPDRGIIYLSPDGSINRQSYPQLLTEAAIMLGAMRRLQLRAGDKVIFQLPHNEDFVPAFWACVLGGFVPVPISIPPSYDEAHATLAKLKNAWDMLERPLILTAATHVSGLEGFGLRERMTGLHVAAVEQLRSGEPDHNYHDNKPEDLALLLLTSGSTGLPKGVQLNHRNVLSRSAATAQMNGFTESEISLNWMPLDHVGGLVMFHIRDVFLGCTQLHGPTETILQRPITWLEWISRHRVTNTWAPNFAFGLVNEQDDDLHNAKLDLSSLRFILNGGEAIVAKTARRFLTTLAPYGLPATSMKPAWGMSETSSGVTYSHRFLLNLTKDTDAFVEVGIPVPGISARIVDRELNVLPEGKIGSLQVKGLTVTKGYFKNPTINNESFSRDGWFITGDLAFIKNGAVTITGREKDVIIVNGANFHSHEIESVVEEIAGVEVSFTAACGIRQADRDTDQLAIFYCPTSEGLADLANTEKSIRNAVVTQIGVNPDHLLALEKDQIPKTAIGKIQRSSLKKSFEDGQLLSPFSVKALPPWFWRKVWRSAELPSVEITQADKDYWIFLDSTGLLAELAKQLTSQGKPVVCIDNSGTWINRAGEHFSINASSTHDYDRLFTELAKRPTRPRTIVYGFTFSDNAQTPTVPSGEMTSCANTLVWQLAAMSKALGELGEAGQTLKLRVVTHQSVAVNSTDRVSLAKAALPGLVRTFSDEITNLDASLIDLPASTLTENRARLLSDLSHAQLAPEVAWRQSGRYTEQLEPVTLFPSRQSNPIKAGGIYLITGGLGGIGLAVARDLLKLHKVKLVLVGRSPLSSATSETGAAFTDLQKLGDVAYEQADVASLTQMKQVAARATTKWHGALDGVFHLAGVYRPSVLAHETADSVARTFQPKVSGIWVLAQLLKDRPGSLLVSFSSVLGFFGGYQHGVYAAANSAIDGWTHELRQLGLRSFALGWSSWANLGMNRGLDNQEAARAKGFQSVETATGLASLWAALSGENPHVLIGLDGTNSRIQREQGEINIVRNTEDADSATPIESALIKIWQGILNVPRVGLNESFFEIGGKSLHAAKMFAQVYRVLGKNLPVPALFKSPTISQLATVFIEQPKSSEVKIKALRTKGKRPPLFIITEAGKEPSSFNSIATTFAQDQPVIALQLKSMTNGLTPTENKISVEIQAALLLTEIQAIAPEGRLAIGGFGFGCLVTWELAQQLAQINRHVQCLTLFSPPSEVFFKQNASPAGVVWRFEGLKGQTDGGLFGRIFKNKSSPTAEITKEARSIAVRYSEATLRPTKTPVVVFAKTNPAQPWTSLAASGLYHHPEIEAAAVLSEHLSP